MIFLQLLINGLIAGSIYALIASGFSFIYTTNKFVHFAHGSTVTISAYLFFWLLTFLNLPLWLAIPLVTISAGIYGFLIHYIIYLPLKKRNSSSVILLIASLGIMIFFDNLMQLLFGADVKILNVFERQIGITFLGAYITPLQIITMATVFSIFIVFWLFKKYSRLGKLMQAVADNPELAKTSGINSINIQHWSFIIGSAIAGLAGILIALENNIEPTMGTTHMVSSYTGAIIGGVDSLMGSILGSYFIGILSNFCAWFLPSSFASAFTIILLFIFLLIKPQGILGIKKGTRE